MGGKFTSKNVWCNRCEKSTVRYLHSKSCVSCAGRTGGYARMARLTPEERSAVGTAAHFRLTPEERSSIARKAGRASMAKLSAEERRVKARKASLSVSPEQHRENSRRGGSMLSIEQLSENGRKGGAATTGEVHAKWTGDLATCRAVHMRLRVRYGTAARYPCIRCGMHREVSSKGESAMHWSYDGYAPDERRDLIDDHSRYTTDLRATIKNGLVLPLWYSPRCAVPCHILYDVEHGLRG